MCIRPRSWMLFPLRYTKSCFLSTLTTPYTCLQYCFSRLSRCHFSWPFLAGKCKIVCPIFPFPQSAFFIVSRVFLWSSSNQCRVFAIERPWFCFWALFCHLFYPLSLDEYQMEISFPLASHERFPWPIWSCVASKPHPATPLPRSNTRGAFPDFSGWCTTNWAALRWGTMKGRSTSSGHKSPA